MSESARQSKTGSSDKSLARDDTNTPIGQSHDDLMNDLDQLLDQIDEVLESNAEEFVKNYVQKGGE